MFDLDLLRAHALSHPLVLSVLCLAIYKVAGTFAGKVPATFATQVPATVVMALLYSATVIFYVSTSAYFDHVEPAVAAVSWAVMRGQEAYPGPAAAEMYGLPYGPMLYLLNGLTLRALGPSIVTSKVAGACGALVSFVVLAAAARRSSRANWPRAIRWTALLYLVFGATTFWARAEPLLLLCSSLALLSLTLPAVASAIVAGIALGVGVDLKVSAVLYLLPALAVLWKKHGVGNLVATVGVGALAAALPFLIFDNISATGYLYWVRTTTTHGIRAASIPTALEWAVFVVAPVIVAGRADARPGQVSQMTIFRALLIASVFVSLPMAAKHGTGSYHFLPFIPLIAFATTNGLNHRQHGQPGLNPVSEEATLELRYAPAWLLTCVVLAAFQLPHWITRTTELPAREIISELREIEAKYDGAIAMGYTPNYPLSFFRPLLVFDGHPYLLDATSMMDRHWSRAPFPPAAIDALRACRVDVWLIPAGDSPFFLPNAYPIAGQVIPEEFRLVFEARYQVVESGRWFDVWRCQK